MVRTVVFAWGDIQRVGGTERRMAECATELTKRGYRVVSLFQRDAVAAPLAAVFEGSGVEPITRSSSVRYLVLLRRLAVDAEAVVSFGLRPSLLARLVRLTAPRGARHFMARNGLDYGWRRAYHLVDRATSRGVDRYIANSRAVGEHLAAKGIAPQRIRVVLSGLPSEWFRPATRAEDTGTSPTTVMMVGNTRPEKNQIVGLSAVSSLSDALRVDVYTDDRSVLEADLPAAVRSDPRIHIHENILVTPETYDGADIFLHPSRAESLPRVVLEAATRGCAVVAYDVGDTKAVVDPKRSRILPFREDDPTGLAAALAPFVRNTTSLRAQRTVGGGRTVEKYTDELVTVLGDVIR